MPVVRASLVGWVIAGTLGFAALLLAFLTPVHITPANGSLRCINSILSPDSSYRGDPIAESEECDSAVANRKVEGAVAIAAALSIGLVGEVRRRGLAITGQLVAAIVVLLLFGSIALNLAG